MIQNRNIYILSFITFLSLVVGYYFGEDTLGRGEEDYKYHIRFLEQFSENFMLTYNEFGLDQEVIIVRNSPFFYMFFSIFLKIGLSLEHLRLINFLIIFPFFIFFFKCLDIKYSKIDLETKLIFASALLLSPTVRTLIIWPYPLMWALCFFLISLYFFLTFEKTHDLSKKATYAYSNLFFLAISAYFTPNFAIFALFFFYKFLVFYKFKKETFIIILINISLAIPAIYFLVSKDFYLLKSTVNEIDNSTKYNLSNKIIIISTIAFLFFLPYISIKNFYYKIKNNFKIDQNFFILLFFIVLNLYFYNFDTGPSNAGGGIFYHFSKLLFGNSLILFLVFIFSLYVFKYSNLYSFNNIFLFFILIFYNLQFSIYYKYFDPLIFLIFLFITEFKEKKFIDIVKISKRYYLLYLVFLSLNFGKLFINY
jgi:hypothetical protein